MPVEIIDSLQFSEKVKNGSGVFLVDFYADLCTPCKALSPILDKLSEINKDKVTTFKLNIDKSKDLAVEYNITSIPCMILFKDGKEVARTVGFKGVQGVQDLYSKNV